MKRALLTLLFVCPPAWVSAQSLVGVPDFIRVQRDDIQQQRETITAAFTREEKLCWQKFAVNACLRDARQQRRLALEPLRQKDLLLNAQERNWRSEQRELRLQGKQPESKTPP